MKSTKEKYQEYCSLDQRLPLFLKYNWMQAVAGENWDVIIDEINGEMNGLMVFGYEKRKGFKIISNPYLTPYNGLWLNYPDGQKPYSRLSYEKKTIFNLLKKLPDFDKFLLRFYPSVTNWLPFYWKSFHQTTRYTYIIDKDNSSEAVFEGFRENVRRQIRKTEKNLEIIESDDLNTVYDLKIKSYRFKKQKFVIPYHTIQSIGNYCRDNECGKVLLARDSSGNIHSGILIVWDQFTCYYLLGAADPDFKNSGAMSLLLWKAIQFSISINRSYDFEGSMIKPVENFFRTFGGHQTPYFQLSKTNSILLKMIETLK